MIDFRKIVEEQIKKSITAPLQEANKFQQRRSDDLRDAVLGKVNGSEELRGAASNLGINLDYSDEERDALKRKTFNKDNTFKKGAVKDINRRHKAAIMLLRKFVVPSPKRTATGEEVLVPGGAILWDQLKDELESNPGKYANLTFDEVCRIKDNLDLHNMRNAYDPSFRGRSYDKFGTFRANRNDKFLNIDDFDFNSIYSEKQIKAAQKTDKGPNRTEEEAIEAIKRVTAERYLDTQYGIKMEIPGVSMGNKKVKNAMIINFTSAFRCPAWNDCLVKHACYARSGEMQHNNVKFANDRRNLMWLSAQGDEKMMKLIHAYLLSHLVSWPKVKDSLTKMANEEILMKVEELSGEAIDTNNMESVADAMSKMWCHELVEIPGMAKILESSLVVNDIRINENGDFINQQLLEEFDQYIAGEFALIGGVSCAAYSCRNLQFGNIQHVIINASRTGMSDEGEGAKYPGKAIERYFVAIPTDMYDCFEDTFSSYDVGEDKVGALGSLRSPQPLYAVVEGPDGRETYGDVRGYYYKCPCERKDFQMNGGKFNVNCYNCHMCYERVSGIDTKKMFVFVRAHGSESSYLGEQREKFVKKHMGVSKDYFEKMEKLLAEKEAKKQNGKNKKLKEGIEMPERNLYSEMEREGLQTITENAIMSMTQHFMEVGKQNQKFNEMFERLKKPIHD